MFKLTFFVALCIFAFAECSPAPELDSFKMENSEDNLRVERSLPNVGDVVQMAGRVANKGIGVANTGVNMLSSAAQKAITAGSSIAAKAANVASHMIL